LHQILLQISSTQYILSPFLIQSHKARLAFHFFEHRGQTYRKLQAQKSSD
jgi:hypothetical protein